mmetsp:Transcript_138298/g.350559  ORF Transcript_138298/g.350559 Transcript_138298/m.350559 type:complete len:244 (-) Transcript_138298:13-744(-)
MTPLNAILRPEKKVGAAPPPVGFVGFSLRCCGGSFFECATVLIWSLKSEKFFLLGRDKSFDMSEARKRTRSTPKGITSRIAESVMRLATQYGGPSIVQHSSPPMITEPHALTASCAASCLPPRVPRPSCCAAKSHNREDSAACSSHACRCASAVSSVPPKTLTQVRLKLAAASSNCLAPLLTLSQFRPTKVSSSASVYQFGGVHAKSKFPDDMGTQRTGRASYGGRATGDNVSLGNLRLADVT